MYLGRNDEERPGVDSSLVERQPEAGRKALEQPEAQSCCVPPERLVPRRDLVVFIENAQCARPVDRSLRFRRSPNWRFEVQWESCVDAWKVCERNGAIGVHSQGWREDCHWTSEEDFRRESGSVRQSYPWRSPSTGNRRLSQRTAFLQKVEDLKGRQIQMWERRSRSFWRGWQTVVALCRSENASLQAIPFMVGCWKPVTDWPESNSWTSSKYTAKHLGK